jgi:hypothetical protein
MEKHCPSAKKPEIHPYALGSLARDHGDLSGRRQGIVQLRFLANALRPNTRFLSVIGSYGWGGKAVETLAGMIPNLKVDVIDPVL